MILECIKVPSRLLISFLMGSIFMFCILCFYNVFETIILQRFNYKETLFVPFMEAAIAFIFGLPVVLFVVLPIAIALLREHYFKLSVWIMTCIVLCIMSVYLFSVFISFSKGILMALLISIPSTILFYYWHVKPLRDAQIAETSDG